jgi:subtilisin-like proprotein convertase family protein
MLAVPVGTRGATFTNTARIVVPVGALTSPYPSPISVSNAVGVIANVSVTLVGLAHSFPDDLDILLAGPGGQTVLLMSDAGGGNTVSNINLRFSDDIRLALPDAGQIVGGSYEPSNYGPGDMFPAPAPAGPYGAAFSVFESRNPNGTWRLFVVDDATANVGAIAGGWRLDLDLTNFPPVIVAHPQSQTVAPGDAVTFTVGVSGTPPFGYQWLRNGQVIVPFGQGAPSLTISNVQPGNAGSYAVVITNAANRFPGVTSSNANLNVLGPLVVVQPPRDQTADPGGEVTFRVTAAGTPPLFYQWKLNGAVLSGQTNSTFTLGKLEAISGGSFSVTVWNANEVLTTDPAVLRVIAATDPSPPSDTFSDRRTLHDAQGILQGNSALATTQPGEPLMTGGGQSVWYQWVAPADGIATFTTRGSAFDTLFGVFTGNTLSNLALVTADDELGGFYTSALKFNAHGGTAYQLMLDGFDYTGTGGEFTLSWMLEATSQTVPIIVSPPQPIGVVQGSNATFRVLTDSTDTSYQWFFRDEPIPGATGFEHTISNAASSDVGYYFVRAGNNSGKFTDSAPADLQITSGSGALRDDNFHALIHDRYQNGVHTQSNGNRPGAGFISIGLGDTIQKEAPSGANDQQGDPNPCNYAFNGTAFQYLIAEDDGLIQVDTDGSETLTRMAVYLGELSFITNNVLLACDVTNAPAMNPSRVVFEATEGTKYSVVIEGYQASGNLTITSTMGVAPPVVEAPKFCGVTTNGSFLLTIPANTWIPVPACQWRLEGTNLTGGTNTTLLLTNFNAVQAGTYSVVFSNFVSVATNTVAHLMLAGPLTLEYAWTTNNGSAEFVISAADPARFVLQSTTNLNSAWLPLATNQDSCATLSFTNANPLFDSQRFFRAVAWSPP